jgi:hypothetical protein
MKLFYLLLVFLLAIAIVNISAQEIQENEESISIYTGTWKGTVAQPDYGDYTVTIKFINDIEDTEQTKLAEVEYPTLKCSGFWTINKFENNVLRLVETIERGINNCIDNGLITLSQEEDYIKYEWYYPDGKLGASANLYKE